MILGGRRLCGRGRAGPPRRGPAGQSEADPAEDVKAEPARLAGCPKSKKGDEAPKVEGPKAENAKPDAGAAKLTADELAAIKELPAAEQELAIQQARLPGERSPPGLDGQAIKVTAEGRTFYLCCESCRKELKAIPRRSSPSWTNRRNCNVSWSRRALFQRTH